MLAEAARGSEIALCICSRGEAASNGTPAEREAEARTAAKLLGASIEFLEMGGDSHMEASALNAIAIARCIRALRPDIMLAPVTSPDQHPDHTAIGQVCLSAARLARYGGLENLRELPPHAVTHCLGYAVTPAAEPSAERPSVRVDISAHFDRWIELMQCHTTQLKTRRYIDLQTARARLLGLEAGVEYAQAIFPTDPWIVESLSELPRSVRLF